MLLEILSFGSKLQSFLICVQVLGIILIVVFMGLYILIEVGYYNGVKVEKKKSTSLEKPWQGT